MISLYDEDGKLLGTITQIDLDTGRVHFRPAEPDDYDTDSVLVLALRIDTLQTLKYSPDIALPEDVLAWIDDDTDDLPFAEEEHNYQHGLEGLARQNWKEIKG